MSSYESFALQLLVRLFGTIFENKMRSETCCINKTKILEVFLRINK